MTILSNVTFDWQNAIFLIIGGLGLFLFGITLMSSSLTKLAGSKFQIILEKTTNTPLKGILTGALMTLAIQSSSATTAIVIGLVGAGLLTLKQGVGVIFGANIGTTITSLLISLDLGAYGLPIIFAGAVLIFFIKNKKVKNVGEVLMGLGMLFYGLEVTSSSLEQFGTLPQFTNFLNSIGKIPILGVLVGAGITAVVQSSSATIGVLQQLYQTGTLSLVGAIAIVFGTNIGTTLGPAITAVGGKPSAKKAAWVHIIFNVFGTLLFFIFLRPYAMFITWLSNIIGVDPAVSKLTISMSHIFFQLITAFILFWFIDQLIWLINKIVRKEDEFVKDDVVLDCQLLKSSPSLALENVKQAIVDMGNLTKGMLEYAYSYCILGNEEAYEYGLQSESVLNQIEVKIHNYLVELGSQNLDRRQMLRVAKDIDTITDLERIGDHLENIIEFFVERKNQGRELNEAAEKEIDYLFDFVRNQLNDSLESYYKNDRTIANQVREKEYELNNIIKEFRNNHIIRIRDKGGLNGSSYFVDILSNLERIGDHCDNIAENVGTSRFTHTTKKVR